MVTQPGYEGPSLFGLALGRSAALGLAVLGLAVLQPGCTKINTVTPDGRSGGNSAGSATGGRGGGTVTPVIDGGQDLPAGSGGTDGGRGGVRSPEDAPQASDVSAVVVDGAGVVNDARPTVDAICLSDGGAYTTGPLLRRCAVAASSECDGRSDINPQLPNGRWGNGYDDDCDGKVDEGCSCDAAHPVGTTKVCSLASPTQVDPATKEPTGWCRANSLGTVRCSSTGEEFAPSLWDGECRGAQPPFADDVCAPGDFDCDGRDLNSKAQNCACKADVHCPTQPIVTKPFPDPNNLLAIDGADWVEGGAANARNWKWTVIGGDCDNILPHPTFAIYGQQRATVGGPRLSSNVPQAGLGASANQRGFVVGPAANVGPVIYPAFSLSGDYLAKGEWDSPDGTHHSCTVKVQVRSPGLRVEMCWDNMPQDVDLHLARLQNPVRCTHGWFATCTSGEDGDDCYYLANTGCAEPGFSTNPSAWGYARSPANTCHGWGSTRTAGCDNPRLDVDNIECDPAIADPMLVDPALVDPDAELDARFCSPENINLDNPKNGDRFAVGVHFYNAPPGVPPPHPHVNVYCNGERRLAFGFDPTAMPPKTFPRLLEHGSDLGGDLWEVATIEAKVNSAGALEDCVITPIRSRAPRPDRDGSNDICVDTNPQNSPTLLGDDLWKFTASGAYPATADAFCWH